MPAKPMAIAPKPIMNQRPSFDEFYSFAHLGAHRWLERNPGSGPLVIAVFCEVAAARYEAVQFAHASDFSQNLN